MTDLIIALGLIGIVIVVFLLSRMKLLPKKTLPYIALALLAGLGIAYFKTRKDDKVKKEIERLKEDIKKREAKVEELKKTDAINVEKLKEISGEIDNKLATHARETLKEKADLEEEKKRLDNLTDMEVFEEYRKAHGADSI
ncbi:MAG: hypothetical protein NT166_12700 [Candidatus Aminicenantes bacterium]|nr:hypothetical protein [Candidatus Aminicenantes bacterium]